MASTGGIWKKNKIKNKTKVSFIRKTGRKTIQSAYGDYFGFSSGIPRSYLFRRRSR